VMWLGELLGLDRLDAYQLLSQVSEAPLANVVDANYSAVTKVAQGAAAPGGRLPGHAPAPARHRRGRPVAPPPARQPKPSRL
jgi:hypothetical protein